MITARRLAQFLRRNPHGKSFHPWTIGATMDKHTESVDRRPLGNHCGQYRPGDHRTAAGKECRNDLGANVLHQVTSGNE